MNRPRHLYPIVLFLLLLLTASVTSCRRDAAFHDALLRAEALMETDPQEARAILDSLFSEQRTVNREQIIPKQSNGEHSSDHCSLITDHFSKGEAAHYALLKTQADYKCRVRLTSDSLPLIATNYYGTKRKTQHAALAQYYLGCTYKDMRRDLDAIDALLRATTLFPDTTNKYFANSLFELGRLYMNHQMNDEAIATFSRYRLSEACKSDSMNIGYADYYIGIASLYKGDNFRADSLFQIVIYNTKIPTSSRYNTYFQLAKLYFYEWHKAEESLDYINRYINYFGENEAATILKGDILSAIHQPELAYNYYNKTLQQSTDIYAICTAYKGLAKVTSQINKTDSIPDYIDQYTVLLDSIYGINRQKEIAEIKDSHVIEIHDQQLKARHARFMFWMGILAVVLLSGTAITFLLIDRKRKKRYLQAQEELWQANVEVLRAQVDEQPADLDALYQKKLAACQKLFRRTPSARLLLVPPASLTAAQRQTLMDDLTRSFVDIMLDVKNASNAVNDQELMYCILSSLQCSTAQMAELLNTTESTLRSRKARLKEKMPDNLHSLFLS